MHPEFEITSGSVRGSAHERSGRNNQDAVSCISNGYITAAVVCDGCGSAPHSEVGAKLAAALSLRWLVAHHQCLASEATEDVLEELRLSLLETLSRVSAALGAAPEVVVDYFLFTLVGAFVTPEKAVVFGLGDGIFAVNGEVHVLTSPDNAPTYLGYGLLAEPPACPEPLRFRVYAELPSVECNSLLVGSDGVGQIIEHSGDMLPGRDEAVGGLPQFWEDDKYFANPALLSRRLLLMNRTEVKPNWERRQLQRQHPLLSDDATVAVIRRGRWQ